MDLDQLRLKTSEELNPDEKLFIKQNEDKLTDEDKDAYADFLGTTNDDSGNGQDDSGQGADGDGAGDSGDSGSGDGSAGDVTPPPGLVFKDEDEAKAFVAKTVAEEQEKQKQAAIDAAKTPEDKKYVEENWKPKDWNEGIKVAVQAALDAVEEKKVTETKVQEAARKAYEAEWDGIVTANNLPKRDTEEGKKVLKAVYDVGVKYSQPTFTKAYELYKTLPTSAGGALELGEKGKSNPNRQAAGKVSGNTPNQSNGNSIAPKTYQDLHGKTQSQLIRDALKATA